MLEFIIVIFVVCLYDCYCVRRTNLTTTMAKTTERFKYSRVSARRTHNKSFAMKRKTTNILYEVTLNFTRSAQFNLFGLFSITIPISVFVPHRCVCVCVFFIIIIIVIIIIRFIVIARIAFIMIIHFEFVSCLLWQLLPFVVTRVLLYSRPKASDWMRVSCVMWCGVWWQRWCYFKQGVTHRSQRTHNNRTLARQWQTIRNTFTIFFHSERGRERERRTHAPNNVTLQKGSSNRSISHIIEINTQPKSHSLHLITVRSMFLVCLCLAAVPVLSARRITFHDCWY